MTVVVTSPRDLARAPRPAPARGRLRVEDHGYGLLVVAGAPEEGGVAVLVDRASYGGAEPVGATPGSGLSFAVGGVRVAVVLDAPDDGPPI